MFFFILFLVIYISIAGTHKIRHIKPTGLLSLLNLRAEEILYLALQKTKKPCLAIYTIYQKLKAFKVLISPILLHYSQSLMHATSSDVVALMPLHTYTRALK